MAIDLGDAIVKVKADTSAALLGIKNFKKKAGLAMIGVGTAIVVGLGKASKAAMDFEQAITNAASVTGKTGEEFEIARDKMEDLAKTLGATTVFSADEAANAMYDLASKGFDVASMSVEELQPLLDLAAATQNDLTATTEVTTSTLRGFGLANTEMARVADVFTYAIGNSGAKMELLSESMPIVATSAKIMNISLEETTATLGELYNKGVRAGTAATGLRNVMLDLNAKKKPILDGFAKYKISLEGIDVAADGLAETFKKLRERGLTAVQAAEIFGKRSGTVAAAVLESVDAIEEFTGALDDAGGTARTVAEIQLDTTKGAFKLLGSQIKAVVLEIGGALLPALKWLATAFAGVFGAMAEWMKQHPVLTKLITGLLAVIGAGLVAGGLLLAVTWLKGLIIALAASVKTVLIPAIINATTALLTFLANPVTLGIIAIAALVIAVGVAVVKTIEAHKQLRESQERLEKAEKESEARIAKVRATAIWKQTGFTMKNIQLVKASIEAQYGKTITIEYLQKRLAQADMRELNVAQKKAAILDELRKADLEEAKAAVGEKIQLKATEVAATVMQLTNERAALETSLQEKLAGFKAELAGLEDMEGSEQEIDLARRLIMKTYGEEIIKTRKLVGEKNTEIVNANRQLAISDTQTAADIERAEQRKQDATAEWKTTVETALVNIDQMLTTHAQHQTNMTDVEIGNIRRLKQEYYNMGGGSWYLDIMENITNATKSAYDSISQDILNLVGLINHIRQTLRRLRIEASPLPSWTPEWLRTAGPTPLWLQSPMWESTESPEIQLQQQLLGANLNQLDQAMAEQGTQGVTVNVENMTVSDEEQAVSMGQELYDLLATDVTQGGSNLGFA